MKHIVTSDKEEIMSENLNRLLRSLEAWNRHDLAAYREIYAPEAVIHGIAPTPLGVEATVGAYTAFFAGFPDLRLSIEETICEGERIAVRFSIGGTHQGEFQGIPPTGRRIAVQGITTMHYRDGRIVERWNQLDQLAMLQQLGVLPAPAQA
jgi:steroid delta-isomerase-like uncharacterized protein